MGSRGVRVARRGAGGTGGIGGQGGTGGERAGNVQRCSATDGRKREFGLGRDGWAGGVSITVRAQLQYERAWRMRSG